MLARMIWQPQPEVKQQIAEAKLSLSLPQVYSGIQIRGGDMTPLEKKQSIIRLLVSMDILLHSSAFIGTITSGPSVFVMKVRADESSVTAIDCPHYMFPDCISLSIDERASISREMMTR